MAGDWLKLELTTLDKPEIQAIADELAITPEEVLGRIIRVWRWFDQQTVDGYAPVTLGAVSKIAGRENFAESMAKNKWLELRQNGVRLPNFDRHNGKTAKNRALSKNRMQRYRNA